MQRVPDKEVIWLFVFAPILAKFIGSGHREIEERSRLIVIPPDSTFREGWVGIDPVRTHAAFLDVRENMFTPTHQHIPHHDHP